MTDKLQKLQARLDKAQAQIRELQRKALRDASEVAAINRRADDRRKILAGAWALEEADRSADFARDMRHALGRFYLIRDDDRRLFGFDILTEEQKAAHPKAANIRRGGKARQIAAAPETPQARQPEPA